METLSHCRHNYHEFGPKDSRTLKFQKNFFQIVKETKEKEKTTTESPNTEPSRGMYEILSAPKHNISFLKKN